ncbi:PRC-barrel domain containing protein [Asanoa sp. NPDC049573]|uniref:PRC-barrel domain containing protein n=1 Tax=Asanoa sp. NPDC049573 TaxID=3155396 RepID=UPI0034193922
MEASVFNAWSWRTPALGGGHDQTTPDQGPEGEPAPAVAAADEGGPGFSLDLTGYAVMAVDGEIGKVEKASETDLVVDTGPWIFGRTVLLPAGVVDRVDHQSRTVWVDRTRSQIKDAPEFTPGPDYRDRLAGYYRDTYGGQ